MVSIQKAIAELLQRGATNIYTVRPGTIAPLSQVQVPPLRWGDPGVVVGMYGQEVSATAAQYATTEMRLQIGAEDLITDGQAGDFAAFLGLFPAGQPCFPLVRRVSREVPWVFTFRNQDGANTATPLLMLGFVHERFL